MGNEARPGAGGQAPDRRVGKKRNYRLRGPVIDLSVTGEGQGTNPKKEPVDVEQTIRDMRRNEFLWGKARKGASDRYRR